MSITHTVQQGENLFSIAQKYKIADWRSIYTHPYNSEFARLRPDPDVIMPGDKIKIPDIKPKAAKVCTGQIHVFVVKRNVQQLKVRLLDDNQQPLRNVRAQFLVAGARKELIVDGSGICEVDIEDPATAEVAMDIFLDSEAPEPSHRYTLALSSLDPIDCISGVQARLNGLGYPCGAVDNLYGDMTKAGIQSFEATNAMPLTGKITDALREKIQQQYGC